jgi:pre-mRNA-processing factor SLU7
MSVRNLRIREDTAKYLRNLDVNSAYYDPKTRAMRQNPTPHLPIEDVTFAGDNYIRHSGETVDVMNTQLFAWEQYNEGSELHAQAMPTQVALMKKQYEEKNKDIKESVTNSLKAKYGGEGLTVSMPKELLYGETEAFVEYTRDGRVLRGAVRVRSS